MNPLSSKSKSRTWAGIVVIALACALLTACSPKPSASAVLKDAVTATSAKILRNGAVAEGQIIDGGKFTEVQDPNDAGGHYVNNAVLTGAQNDFKQISRQTPGNLQSFDPIRDFAMARSGETISFNITNFKVLSTEFTQEGQKVTQKIRLKDTSSDMGTFDASVKYTIAAGLIKTASFDKALFNPQNPSEVCMYSPINCAKKIKLHFEVNRVKLIMGKALNAYEVAQRLSEGTQKSYFEQIMKNMDSTVRATTSWTTQNSDASAGSVYDAKTQTGVTFSSYDDPAAISQENYQDGRHGPDNGFVSGIFFDTTDGGSTYFYADILFDQSSARYVITDSQGLIIANLHFEGTRLVDFVDNTIGTNSIFTISNRVDAPLLASKLVGVGKG